MDRPTTEWIMIVAYENVPGHPQPMAALRH